MHDPAARRKATMRAAERYCRKHAEDLIPQPPVAKAKRARGTPEADVQKPVVALMRKRGLRPIAPMNGTHLRGDKQARIRQWQHAVSLGARKGVPDILVMIRGQMVAIEMKAPGGKASPHQLEVHEEMRREGYLVFVADSPEAVVEILDGIDGSK